MVLQSIAGASLAKVDYVEVVNGVTLNTIEFAETGDVIAVAVFFGKTRLIDNIILSGRAR